MRVLVTGSSGFIGQHLVRALAEAGHMATGIDRTITHYANESDFWLHDLTQPPPVFAQFDVTFHLAARLGPQEVVAHPSEILRDNIRMTELVAQIPTRRLIFASSSEVYGKSAALPFREDGDVVLGDMRNPRWAYAVSKLAGEQIILDADGIVARIFNCSGPGQSHHYVLPRWVEAATKHEQLTVYGDGLQSRSFTHGADTVAGLIALMEHGERGGIYNVGNNQPVKMIEAAQLVQQIVCPSPLVFMDSPVGDGEMRVRIPDNAKLRRLGWQPTRDLRDIITDIAAEQSHASGKSVTHRLA